MEEGADLRLPLVRRDTSHLEPERHVLLDRFPGKQRMLLEHHTAIYPWRGDRFPIHQDLALRGLEKASHRVEQGGFATSRSAQQRHKLSGVDGERHILYSLDGLLAARISYRNV